MARRSFRATRHAPSSCGSLLGTLYGCRAVVVGSDVVRAGYGWPPTLELMGSSFRPRTVPHIPRSLKASRRVRTTLMQYGTLEGEGVPMLQATPSVDWDSLHVVHTMQRQGGDASRVAPCPVPLSHRSASPIGTPCTPCTLGRLDAFTTREGGVSGGCETSIPQPLKYMHHLFVFVLLLIVRCCMRRTDAWIVNAGVDTLVLNAYLTENGKPVKRDLDDTLAATLDQWKKQAQAESEPSVTPWQFNGFSLLMAPNGASRGQYPYMLKTHHLTLYIATGKFNGIASVRLSSEYLWASPSLLHTIVEVNSFLYEIFNDPMYLQVSSVDLCADVAGWHDITTLDRRMNFVSRSRKRAGYHDPDIQTPQHDASLVDHSSGLAQTGFDFSKRGVMSCTIYDKTREIEKSGKLWFCDLWAARGWRPDDGPVWRDEFKYKRQALHELQQGDLHGIENAYDLAEHLPLLWAYAAGHVGGGADGLPDGWLRCVLPSSDSNRARWPTHPVWAVVQSAYTVPLEVPEHFGKIIRKRREEHNVGKAIAAIVGYSTSLSAWVGEETDNDFSVFLHYLHDEGQKVFERKGTDFAHEVERKRVKLYTGQAAKTPRLNVEIEACKGVTI